LELGEDRRIDEDRATTTPKPVKLIRDLLAREGKDDISGRYAPNEWAMKAVEAYRRYEADRIVAEVNAGGDMVQATLPTIDPNVSFMAVHASRGKVIRAEPVAALYEQRKVHHVGSLSVRRSALRLHIRLRSRSCRLFSGSS
jgi:phage terminase large subunit-like protein